MKGGQVRLVPGQPFFLLFRSVERLARSFGQGVQLLSREWKRRQVQPLCEPRKRFGDNSCLVSLVVLCFPTQGACRGLTSALCRAVEGAKRRRASVGRQRAVRPA